MNFVNPISASCLDGGTPRATATTNCRLNQAGRPRHAWHSTHTGKTVVGRLPPHSCFQTPLLLPLPPPLKSHRLILATEKWELEARRADACQESRKVASSYRRRRFLPPEMPSTTDRPAVAARPSKKGEESEGYSCSFFGGTLLARVATISSRKTTAVVVVK